MEQRPLEKVRDLIEQEKRRLQSRPKLIKEVVVELTITYPIPDKGKWCKPARLDGIRGSKKVSMDLVNRQLRGEYDPEDI